MDLRKMMLVCAVALGGFAVGCGNKCKSSCEDAKDCADATADDKARDCGKSCDDADSLSDAASCSDQYDKLVDCEDDHDACDSNACGTQITTWATCVGGYCATHSSGSKCAALGGDLGS